MTFTTVKHYLTRHNENTYKEIFKQCFNEPWKNSIPFKKDPIIAAVDNKNNVVGFCFVHSETPYPMTYGPGAFMYNLCVAPEHRRRGAATAIIEHVQLTYKQVYSHMVVDGLYHDLMTKLGWVRIGVWREKNIEYATGFTDMVEVDDDPIRSDHYDPDENVIYLS